jgi:hypothetical protein
MEKRTAIFQSSQEAQRKFDYFVTGLTGAVLSYLSQSYQPHRVGWNTESLTPIALIFLVGSFVLGFRRIEVSNHVAVLNHSFLFAGEQANKAVEVLSGGIWIDKATGRAVPIAEAQLRLSSWTAIKDEAHEKMTKAADRSGQYYNWRNWLLYAGLEHFQ